MEVSEIKSCYRCTLAHVQWHACDSWLINYHYNYRRCQRGCTSITRGYTCCADVCASERVRLDEVKFTFNERSITRGTGFTSRILGRSKNRQKAYSILQTNRLTSRHNDRPARHPFPFSFLPFAKFIRSLLADANRRLTQTRDYFF